MDFLAGYSVQIDTQQHVLVLTELPESSARPGDHSEAWWRRTLTQLEQQQTLWHGVHATLKERGSRSQISGDKAAELLKFRGRDPRRVSSAEGFPPPP